MEQKIWKIMNELVVSGATPGINYAVITGENKYIGSIGLRSKYTYENGNIKELREENNINTIYDIASLTKVVCTLPIIFRLYEKNKINLNDKVINYLPYFKHDEITIYDLLTHTSGLPADFNSKEIITYEQVIKKIYSLEIENEKGKFLYSDVGYMILGLVIEKIYGKSLDKVFAEEVASPLEMKNSGFYPMDKMLVAPTEITIDRGILRGIVHDEKACSMNGIAGHAGIFSNLEDLINFSSMILNNGMFNGKKYLDKSTLDIWFTPLIDNNGYSRSFSWFVGDNPNVIEKENTISFNGFTGPSISIDRENNIIIIMLTNRVHSTRNNKLNTQIRSHISDEIYNSIIKRRKFK